MKELHTEIAIAATPERVWHVLTDFSSYPEWNPFIPEASGSLVEGSRLRVKLSPSLNKRGITIKPRVVRLTPNRELRWKGRLPIPGLFQGEHAFEIEADGSGVRFHHWERFDGLLVRFMSRMLDGSTRRGFEALNAALKARAESRA